MAMSFKAALDRLATAASGQRSMSPGNCHVHTRDLLELLHHFRRLDAESRERYIQRPELAKTAFKEGFEMRGQPDQKSPNGCAWRSAEEAWANSDTEGYIRSCLP